MESKSKTLYLGRPCYERKTASNNAWTKQELLLEASKLGHRGLSNKSKDQICDALLKSAVSPLQSMTSQFEQLSFIKPKPKYQQISALDQLEQLPLPPQTDFFKILRDKYREAEISELKTIQENLEWLMPKYEEMVLKWKKTLANCRGINLKSPILQVLCKNTNYITSVMTQLIDWIRKYVLVREANLEPSDEQLKHIQYLLDTFTQINMYSIKNIIANPKMKEFVSEINIKLLGGRNNQRFNILDLLKRSPNVKDDAVINELEKDLRTLRLVSLKI
jgi:hypothetical protein